MRTREQINDVAKTLGLSQRAKSILWWKRFKIPNQSSLVLAAEELNTLTDVQLLCLLNNKPIFDSAHSFHF